MKVAINYSDGVYSLYESDTDLYLDIDDDDWREYQDFLATWRDWQAWIHQLENSDEYQQKRDAGWAKYFETHNLDGSVK